MTNLEEYGMDDTHCVHLECIEQYKLMANYLKERGIEYFTLTERNCMEFPYAYIDGGLHGSKYNKNENDSITFEEWATNRGIFLPLDIKIDIGELNFLL